MPKTVGGPGGLPERAMITLCDLSLNYCIDFCRTTTTAAAAVVVVVVVVAVDFCRTTTTDNKQTKKT